MNTNIVDNPYGYKLPTDMIVKDPTTFENNLEHARDIVKRRLTEHHANYVGVKLNVYFGKTPYRRRSKRVLETVGEELKAIGYEYRVATYADGALELEIKWSGEINE